MFNTLTQDRFAPSIFATERPRPEEAGPTRNADQTEATPSQTQVESEEYEFVLGRRQIASLSFVVLVLISLFTGVAYMAGRSTVVRAASKDAAKKESPSAQAALSTTPDPAAPPVILTADVIATTPITALKPVDAPALDPSLFAEPTPGAIYVQAAVLDRSLAAIVAEGLRAHGFHAFVASSTPDDKTYRVLMGPFPNIAASQTARATLDQLGFNALPQPARN